MIKYSSKSVCSEASCGRRIASALGVCNTVRNKKVPALRNRLYGAVLLALSSAAQAVPQGGEVVVGDATIAVNGDTMDIQQNSQRAIINFQSFDVASQETVNFHQPGSDAVALNRVVGSNLSEIHGAINANGQVYLINPNGVLFGNGAQVNVGGLVVTTLDIADQDFLAGRDAFAGSAEGTIENHGTINADGRVVLLAPDVINRGDITVPGGDITLRASQQALLHTPGSEIPILVDSSEFIGQVTNEGNLQAGNVAMVLDGVSQRDVYDAAINNSGLVRAVHASGSGGSIELHAPGGDVINSGALAASALDGDGGRVMIDAERVFQSGAVKATAANIGAGGNIDLHASEGIVMHSGSAIDASADAVGGGGNVVVLAENATWFTEDASIRARGGKESGDGGFVEVSGREFVSVAGTVDVGATRGEGGLWFIDPTDITITPDMDFNGSFSGSNPATWTLAGAPATSLINVTTLRNTLSNDGDVLISSVSTGTGVGDITFDAALDYNGLGVTHTLTLQAHNEIIFTANGRIYDSNSASAEGLNFVATANNGFTMAGEARISAGLGTININTVAGDATITSLASSLSASNADTVQVYAPAGNILDANPTLKDIDVPNSGFTLHAMGDIGDLLVESNYMNAVSTAGDITLHEEASTSVLRLESPGTVSMYTGAQFSVDQAAPLIVNNLFVDAGTDFRVADTGFAISGDLTVIANSVRGGAATVGTSVILSAANADITLRDGAPARSWTTSFDQLAVNITGGTGALTVVDTDGLTLTSVTTGGDTSFSTTDADLLLTSAPVVAGNLDLATVGSGNLVLPETGLTHGGNLTLLADNLVDSDTSIALGAISADITLRNGAGPGTWATSLDQLTLDISGVSDLALVDTDGLTLTSVTTAGSASFSATNADLMVATAPVIGGDLGLNTIGSGNVVIPDAGLSYTGNVVVAADNLVDSDSDINLAAANADITLRDGTVARNWTTSLDQLALNLASTGDFSLVDADGLTLTSLATGGNASFTTTNADLAFTSSSAVAGDLTLTTSGAGDLVLPTAGFTHSGNLTVVADNLRDTDANVAFGARTADITLRDGAGPSAWATDFDQLVLNITGAGAFSLTDSDGLTLTSAATGGNASFATTGADLVLTTAPVVAGDLSLSTIGSGSLIIPTARFTHSGGTLVIDTDDLLDTNRALTLEAASADITLRNAGGNHSWTTFFDSLSLAVAGMAEVDITDNDGLVLGDVTLAGNASFAANGADLVFTTAPVITGDLSLTTIGSGDVVIPDAGLAPAGNLTVLADNLTDSDSALTLSATSADITLRDGAVAQTWSTSFSQLMLNIAGAGAFALTDSDGLVLTSATTGGNASFAATGADLVLTAAPTVAGDLSLSTIGSGDIAVPDAGLNHGGFLTIAADSVRDSDNSLIVAAQTLSASLRDQQVASNWATTLESLDLTLSGGGALTLNNTGELTVTGLISNNAAALNSTGNLQVDSVMATSDLTLTSGGDLGLASATLGGDLQLTTASAGALITPDAGLTVAGDLAVDVGRLRTTSGASDTSWVANTASFRLRDTTVATALNTQTGALSVIQDSSTDLTLRVADGAQLSTLDSGGNVTVLSPGDLTLTGSNFVVAGELALDVSDNLQVSAAGLTVSNDLRINAANLIANGGGSPSLAGRNADLTLAGNQALALTTRLSQLGVTYAAAGPFSLNNDRNLTLTRFAAPSAPTVGLTVNGTLTIPDSGLAAQQRLTIDAVDLLDSNRSLTLAASQLAVRLSGASSDHTWAVTADELDVLMRGNASLALTDAGGLTLADLDNDGQAVLVENGNFSLALSSGDLTVAADVSAADLSDDGSRAGIIDLAVAQGDMLTQGPAVITSTNRVDQEAGTDSYGIRLRLTDVGAADRTIALGSATQLLAIGGDILIDTRPAGTAAETQRSFTPAMGSVVEAYNNAGDPQSGVVLINGANAVASPGQVIRSGRTLAIVADVQEQGNVLDELDRLDESPYVLEEEASAGPKAAAQFDKVFGTCDELDRKNPHRCRVNAALKAFLSHWLVGGEMPPKTEIR